MERGCLTCGASFTPRTARVRHCAAHEPRGRASRSPTTQMQNAEYVRNRAALLADGPACVLRIHCAGAPATTADHIVAVTDGGTNAMTNLQPACLSCNSARGARRSRGGRSQGSGPPEGAVR